MTYFYNFHHPPQGRKQYTVLVSSTSKHFQTVYEGEIWCLCTVTFDQKFPKLNSRLVYCSRLYCIYYFGNKKMRRFPICTLHTHIAWYVKRAWWQFSFLSADSESIISKEKAAGFASMEDFHYGKTECFRNLVHRYTL